MILADTEPILKNHVALSPTGEAVPIPREVFLALQRFLGPDKPSGSIEIHARNGGVAGVQVHEKLK